MLIRYRLDLLQTGPSRPFRKYFYCFELDHLFLFCLTKTEDEKKDLILVDKFTVRFANRKPISTEYNISIKNYVRKYLLFSIVIIIWGNPKDTCMLIALSNTPPRESLLLKTLEKHLLSLLLPLRRRKVIRKRLVLVPGYLLP